MVKKRKEENPTRWLHEEKGEEGSGVKKIRLPFSSLLARKQLWLHRLAVVGLSNNCCCKNLAFPPLFAPDGFIAGFCSRVLETKRPDEG